MTRRAMTLSELHAVIDEVDRNHGAHRSQRNPVVTHLEPVIEMTDGRCWELVIRGHGWHRQFRVVEGEGGPTLYREVTEFLRREAA